jgi:hypothetical protein
LVCEGELVNLSPLTPLEVRDERRKLARAYVEFEKARALKFRFQDREKGEIGIQQGLGFLKGELGILRGDRLLSGEGVPQDDIKRGLTPKKRENSVTIKSKEINSFIPIMSSSYTYPSKSTSREENANLRLELGKRKREIETSDSESSDFGSSEANSCESKVGCHKGWLRLVLVKGDLLDYERFLLEYHPTNNYAIEGSTLGKQLLSFWDFLNGREGRAVGDLEYVNAKKEDYERICGNLCYVFKLKLEDVAFRYNFSLDWNVESDLRANLSQGGEDDACLAARVTLERLTKASVEPYASQRRKRALILLEERQIAS